MPDNNQTNYLNDLLNLLTTPVHRRRHRQRVLGVNCNRTADEVIDDTGIGPNNETDNQISDDIYILDCGHPARNNVGGQCHYCDSIVCRSCILICSSCGHAVCNLHRVMANFDGVVKPYCRTCAEEIHRSLRLQAWSNAILSFFISSNRNR
jgi:hypothetical protein